MASIREAMLALDRIGVPSGRHWLDVGEVVYDRIVSNIDGLSYTTKGEKAEADKPADLEELQRAGITGGPGKKASWYDNQMARELERLRREDELTIEALNYAGVPLKAECSTSKAAITVASECRRLRGDLSAVNRDVETLHAELDAASRRDETAKREAERLWDKQGQLCSQIADLTGQLLDKSLRIAELKDELNAANKRAERSGLEPSDCGCESHLDIPAYPERLLLAFRVIENHLDGHQVTNGVALALSVLSDELSP